MPNVTRALRLIPAAAFFLAACNPSGTCIPPENTDKSDDSLGSECVVNQSKRGCAFGGRADAQFFPEDRAAGVVRCKTLGYETPRGVPEPPNSDPKAIRIFYKKK